MRFYGGGLPEKKNYFWSKLEERRVMKSHSTGTELKRAGQGIKSLQEMTVNHMTHPTISFFMFCFSKRQGTIKCSVVFFQNIWYFIRYFNHLWVPHKQCRRLKPCQWRRTVHWHWEWDRKWRIKAISCKFCQNVDLLWDLYMKYILYGVGLSLTKNIQISHDAMRSSVRKMDTCCSCS